MTVALSTRGVIAPEGAPNPPPSLVISTNQIDIVWSSNKTLTAIGSDPNNWSISEVVGYPVTIDSVTQPNATTTRLITSNQTSSGSYILNIPAGAVEDDLSGDPNIIFAINFTGVGSNPSLNSASASNNHTVVVTFNTSVLNANIYSNYTFDNGLIAISVIGSGAQYTVTTTTMEAGTLYQLDMSNITDLMGNPLA